MRIKPTKENFATRASEILVEDGKLRVRGVFQSS